MEHPMIASLDHLVLTVADIDATLAFYCGVLGMEEQRFGERLAVRFGSQKINLHRAGHEFEPKSARPTPGSGDLCFLLSIPLADAQAQLEAAGIAIEEGPLRSLYLRDPDDNLIELSVPAG
jgi:catechol 2,3-dioxygenase-like lactoylglutathione lyase family enzyme